MARRIGSRVGKRSAVKSEVRTPKYRMRVVASGKGKGAYKRQKSDNQKWLKGE